jgi:hypothetical protein
VKALSPSNPSVVLERRDLSWTAKGVYAFLCLASVGPVSVVDLAAMSPDGTDADAIRAALAELRRAGLEVFAGITLDEMVSDG